MIEGLKPYAEYKESGQKWLGGIPAHWDLKPGHAAFGKRKESNRGMKEKTVLSLSYGRIKVKFPTFGAAGETVPVASAEERIGEVVQVLVETTDGESRAEHQAPEVDGTTQLTGGPFVIGTFVTAQVVDSEGVDLVATPL